MESAGAQRILVIDDDKSLLDLLSLSFELEGYEALTASNGDEASELLMRNNMEAGASALAFKPIEIASLLTKIRQLV